MGHKVFFPAVLVAALSIVPSGGVLAQGGSSQGATNTYLQLQEMQYEIRELRGMVEELNHEVQRLRQRQIDDYQDLDSRLSGAPATGATPAGADAEDSAPAEPLDDFVLTEPAPAPTAAAGGQDSDSDSEWDSYSAAYELLKERQIEESTEAFKTHLQRYPSGQYAANAHYWLGEIYLLQNDLDAAEASFAKVVNDFARDRKAPDAMFKLGRVYHLQGRDDNARTMFNRVAATDTSAAALARAYLQDNF